jgi:hypothetical protein
MSGVQRTQTAADVLNPMVGLQDNRLNADARTRATCTARRAGEALRYTQVGKDADDSIRNRSFDAEIGGEASRVHLNNPPVRSRTGDGFRLS